MNPETDGLLPKQQGTDAAIDLEPYLHLYIFQCWGSHFVGEKTWKHCVSQSQFRSTGIFCVRVPAGVRRSCSPLPTCCVVHGPAVLQLRLSHPVIQVVNTSGKLTVCYRSWPFIDDLPRKNGDVPVRELLNYQRVIHSNHIPLAGMIPQCWSAPAICQKDISMRFLYPQDPIDMSMRCPKNLHEMSAFRRKQDRPPLRVHHPGSKSRRLKAKRPTTAISRRDPDDPIILNRWLRSWCCDQLGFDLPGDTTRVTLDWRFVMINQRVNVTNWKIGMFERKIIILINP